MYKKIIFYLLICLFIFSFNVSAMYKPSFQGETFIEKNDWSKIINMGTVENLKIKSGEVETDSIIFYQELKDLNEKDEIFFYLILKLSQDVDLPLLTDGFFDAFLYNEEGDLLDDHLLTGDWFDTSEEMLYTFKIPTKILKEEGEGLYYIQLYYREEQEDKEFPEYKLLLSWPCLNLLD